ncbi:nuclear transport factor 2 family protein [Streptomyces sp. NPDC060011]
MVLARYTARNKATGRAMEARVAHAFTIRSGRIVRMEQIVDSATVRAAMT